MNRPSGLALIAVLAVLLGSCSNSPANGVSTPAPAPISSPSAVPSQSTAPGPDWPADGWRTSRPEDQGLDPQALAEMLATIEARRLNLHSLLVIRNGYLVSETYFGSYQADTPHESYSVTKSFVATLIGIALDRGAIDQLDRPIVDYFPEQAVRQDPQKQAITLEDLLTMRAGLDWREDPSSYEAMARSPDWVQFVLDLPMAGPPGLQFNYCTGCSHLLSALLEPATGMNPRAFAEETLFGPLGIRPAGWATDAAGTPIGGWGLQLTPRDMAKLGHLYLQQGEWAGQRIVSADWIETATQTHTPTEGDLGYGYQWWTDPALGAYAALGREGQMIFVVPGDDLVIVTTAKMDSHEEIFELIERYILSAVQSPL